MYSLNAVLKGLKTPGLVLREINVLYHTRLGRRKYNPEGIDVEEEDWDNLIILDACRYDLFMDENVLPGELESRISRGSSTPEFLDGSFSGKELHDLVYVTSNPFVHNRDLDTEFHSVVNVWKEEGWDDTYGTVTPATMNEYANHAIEEYPDKRLVIHYMQPHYPFLTTDTEFDKGHFDTEDNTTALWRKQLVGDVRVPRERIWSLYRENLRAVLPHVEELMQIMGGKTVVTADHGNMIGERAFPLPVREWGHPRGLYLTPLVKVPWLVHQEGGRRRIEAGKPGKREELDEEEIKSKLEDLGYA